MQSNLLQPFTPTDSLRSLVAYDRHLLVVVSRFGLSFGFGDKTVVEACEADGVDCGSFLAVCNLLTGRDYSGNAIDLSAMMAYLRRAHSYFLEYVLPGIRRQLVESISTDEITDVTMLLLKFFDEFVREVANHMNHENDTIFSYVSGLLGGNNTPTNFRISDYSRHHSSMADKLTALKDVFLRHYHIKDNQVLTSALLDIIECGDELDSHCLIEDRLFTPEVEKLEQTLHLKERDHTTDADDDATDAGKAHRAVDSLTQREKDVLCCVAQGLANKEIADRLCLSVHTVTTYRRNLSSKLGIHSPAGLTIFAILNGLIDIRDINPHL